MTEYSRAVRQLEIACAVIERIVDYSALTAAILYILWVMS